MRPRSPAAGFVAIAIMPGAPASEEKRSLGPMLESLPARDQVATGEEPLQRTSASGVRGSMIRHERLGIPT